MYGEFAQPSAYRTRMLVSDLFSFLALLHTLAVNALQTSASWHTRSTAALCTACSSAALGARQLDNMQDAVNYKPAWCTVTAYDE